MRFKAAKTTHEFTVIPTFGWINERYYYGYPVIAIAFAWLCWRLLKKWEEYYEYRKGDQGNSA